MVVGLKKSHWFQLKKRILFEAKTKKEKIQEREKSSSNAKGVWKRWRSWGKKKGFVQTKGRQMGPKKGPGAKR